MKVIVSDSGKARVPLLPDHLLVNTFGQEGKDIRGEQIRCLKGRMPAWLDAVTRLVGVFKRDGWHVAREGAWLVFSHTAHRSATEAAQRLHHLGIKIKRPEEPADDGDEPAE